MLIGCVGRAACSSAAWAVGSTLGARAGSEEVGDLLGPRPAALAIGFLCAERALITHGAAG